MHWSCSVFLAVLTGLAVAEVVLVVGLPCTSLCDGWVVVGLVPPVPVIEVSHGILRWWSSFGQGLPATTVSIR